MAINKKLIHFKEKSVFEEKRANNEILDTSIVFVKDAKEIWTHGQFYKSVNWSILTPPPQNAGDVVYYANGILKVTPFASYDASMGTAVGVIVIPSGMLPDGKARMIGLHGANNNDVCRWSLTSTDTSLPNLDTVPTTDNAGSTTTGSGGNGYLPSDNFQGAQSFVDPQAKYYSSRTPYIPSPYLADGRLNPEFTKSSLANNALADFNGKSNTDTLVELGSDYVAANAAKNYSVEGINIDWYLPACGELAFLPVRYKSINDSIVALGGTSVPYNFFWSSSEYSSSGARIIVSETGELSYNVKHTSIGYVRAFALVP